MATAAEPAQRVPESAGRRGALCNLVAGPVSREIVQMRRRETSTGQRGLPRLLRWPYMGREVDMLRLLQG
jgi:hypothetical protein